MARKPPPFATRFKKGQSGNPKGRPILTEAQRELRKLTLSTYREVIETALTGNLAALKALAEDPDTPAIQVGVATSIMKAIKVGDASVLERFAARIVGKIPDEINLNSVNNTTLNANVNVIDKEALARAIAELKDEV